MKAKYKKLLLASATVGVMTPFLTVGGAGIAHAEGSSNNTLTVSNTDANNEHVNAGETFSDTEDADNNTTIVRNVQNISFLHGGYAPSSSGSASNNTVYVYGGTIYHIHAGHIGSGVANYNKVFVYDGTVTGLTGAGYASSGEANYNELYIYGGNLSGLTQGGYIIGSGNAIGNTVNIYGGTITGNIYGGYVGGSGEVKDNTINVYGSPDLSSAYLYAGYLGGNTNLYGSNNHMNIGASGITAINIGGFDSLNFFIPSDAVDGSKTLLTLTDSSGTNLGQTAVNVRSFGNADIIPNTTITLLTNSAGLTTSNATFGSVLSQGVSILYPVSITASSDGNSILATVSGEGTVNPKIDVINVKPPVDTPMIELPDIGGTFPEFDLTGDDPNTPTDVTQIESQGWNIFANVGGGPMKYKTGGGSYVDTTNQNVDVGFARSINHNEANRMTIAPVIDYQNTNYDSYLADGTHGRGNSKYKGAGVVVRNMNRGGFYWEGSLRFGRVDTDFASEDLDPNGAFGSVTYDTEARILTGYAKFGKYLRLDKNNLLNIYGFYNHTYQGKANADLSSGEHYNFSSTNAGRLRLGYRLTTRTSRISQVYTGLAYQFERNTGVTATFKGYSTSNGSHSGSSGMLEIGWLVKPLRNSPWVVDINTTGWIGNQRGVKATAKIQKSF